MKQGNDFMVDLLDFDPLGAQADVLWRAYKPVSVTNLPNTGRLDCGNGSGAHYVARV